MTAIDLELTAASAKLSEFITVREKDLSKMHLGALRLARASIEGVAAAIKSKGIADSARKRIAGDPEF